MHRELAFSNFIIRETLREQASSATGTSFVTKKTDLQLGGQTKFLHSPDEPLGRVVLVPFDGVSVVHGELVVEIVITLSDGDKGSDHMVAGCMFIIERSLAKPVSE